MTFHTLTGVGEIPTLGVELEYQVVDPNTRELSSETETLLTEADQLHGSFIRPEFHMAMVETLTAPCGNVSEIGDQIRELRRTLVGLGRKHGLKIAAASTHPITHWKEVRLTGGDRYLQIQRDLGDVARSNLIYGMHCHVGIADPQARIAVMNSARTFLPVLLALSCSSPFWQGRDSGMATTRTGIFRRFPRTGVPQFFDAWEEFEGYVSNLVKTGCIDNAKKIYWDIRPHPFFPTIEFRVCDVPTRLRETLAITALIHVISTRLLNLWHRDMTYQLHRRAYINENMYRAMRHGMNGDFIDLQSKKLVPAKDVVRSILEDFQDEIALLGVEREMGWVEEIVAKGNSADRQREVFSRNEKMEEVVDHLIAETEEDIV